MKRKPPPQADLPAEPAPARSRWRDFLTQQAVGYAVSPLFRFAAAFVLGLAIVLLSAAWLVGPQRLIDAWRFRTYTSTAVGHIADSWLALEFDAAMQGDRGNWTGPARATHCAIVAYEGDWGAPLRRAYCGNRLNVHSEDTLPRLVDDTTMAPGVPFAMPRDERGFLAPQVRIGTAERDWLQNHPPWSDFNAAGAKTAWEALRLQLDRPLEYAVAGWGLPAPTFPLALDPRDPAGAMPKAYVDGKRGASIFPLFASLPFLFAGAWLWLRGMGVLMLGLPRAPMLFAALLPLLTLPWWGESMPRVLARLQPQVAEIVADMLADIDITGRLVASAPADAQLARGGERLVWRVGEGSYADTIGRIAFALPRPPPADADAALRQLVADVSTQVRAFDPAQRTVLFDRLAADKQAGRYGAALPFLPAAEEAALGVGRSVTEAHAAYRFLDAWVTSPVDDPWSDQPAFGERVALWRGLLDLPEVTIVNRARWIVDAASKVGH